MCYGVYFKKNMFLKRIFLYCLLFLILMLSIFFYVNMVFNMFFLRGYVVDILSIKYFFFILKSGVIIVECLKIDL